MTRIRQPVVPVPPRSGRFPAWGHACLRAVTLACAGAVACLPACGQSAPGPSPGPGAAPGPSAAPGPALPERSAGASDARAGAGPGAEAQPADDIVVSAGALFTVDDLRQLRAQVLDALERGAGVRLERPVPVLLLDRADARARRKAFAAGLDEHAGMTSAMDLAADFVFSDSMLGRYLPDEKVFYVIDEVLRSVAGGRDRKAARELLFAVMAHELVHAHDDQVYGNIPSPASMTELMQDPARLPELQAFMGLIEGHATWLSERACRFAGVEPLPVPTEQEAREAKVMTGDGALQGALAGAVNVVARAKFMQYAWGREFCRRADAFGGEAFMRQVFDSTPVTLDELKDFDTFKLRWAAEQEARLDAQEESAGEGAPDAVSGS